MLERTFKLFHSKLAQQVGVLIKRGFEGVSCLSCVRLAFPWKSELLEDHLESARSSGLRRNTGGNSRKYLRPMHVDPPEGNAESEL